MERVLKLCFGGFGDSPQPSGQEKQEKQEKKVKSRREEAEMGHETSKGKAKERGGAHLDKARDRDRYGTGNLCLW